MNLATQTLEVIGIRRKDDDTVTVELGAAPAGGPAGAPTPAPFVSHVIEVARTAMPALGTAVTLTFAVEA